MNKDSEQKSLDKVTDYIEDNDADEKKVNNVLSDFQGKTKKENIDFQINENDIEYIMKEFCLEKSKSLQILRSSKGNLKSAITYLINH